MAASSLPSPGPSRFGERSPRRRAASIALTVAAHLLLAWLLLHLGPSWVKRSDEPSLSTFDVAAPPGRIEAPTPRVAQNPRAAAGGAPAAARAVRTSVPQPTPVPQTETQTAGPAMLALDYDLGKAPRRGAGEGDADGDARGDSVAAYGPGAGPGGERLYNAEWYREPRPAELNGYLPNGVPPDSWALIACRTIPDNQVENCRSLGESPVGSGLARAMRQAAWQFRIRPPRRNGKPLIGEWVQIHFTWTTRGLETR